MLNSRFSPMGAVLSDMQRMSDGIDRALRSTNGSHRCFADAFPPVNIWESDDTIYVESELPGFDLDGVTVMMDHATLTLEGDRKPPEIENGVWGKHERGQGKFHRKIRLPAKANPDSVEASLKNGVLTLKIAKCEDAKTRRIEVKAD